MARNHGSIEAGQVAIDEVQVGAANPAREYAKEKLSRIGLADFTDDDLERLAWARELHRTHFLTRSAQRARKGLWIPPLDAPRNMG